MRKGYMNILLFVLLSNINMFHRNLQIIYILLLLFSNSSIVLVMTLDRKCKLNIISLVFVGM